MSPYRLLAAAGLLTVTLAAAGCADKDPSSPLHSMETGKARVCLMAPLDNTKILNDSTLLMTDRTGTAAVAHMTGSCMIDPTSPVIMKYHGTNEICGPLDVDISGTVTGGLPISCLIKTIEPVSKAQAQALMNGKAAQ